jgi:hypothetical protein
MGMPVLHSPEPQERFSGSKGLRIAEKDRTAP